jgi:hypothetical protein
LLTRPITYAFTNDAGEEVTETETFHFHIFEEELLEMEAEHKEGLIGVLQRYLKEEDKKNLFAFFKKMILDSYGVRMDGGRRFEKNPELRAKFETHAAYKALFKELAFSENAAEKMGQFLNDIMPKMDLPQDKPAEVVASKPI